MVKSKRIYVCGACGAHCSKWQGQCPDCGAWNALAESALPSRGTAAARPARLEPLRLDSVGAQGVARLATGFSELDRVLGGGLVPGSVVLIGGDPGIGKSTLLLSAVAQMAFSSRCCYVTGEESPEQVSLRAARLGCGQAPVELLAETSVEAIVAHLQSSPPAVLVIDSIQTLSSEHSEAAPGAVSQLRESAAQLVRFAKTEGVATLLVGHVTKEGTLAGPRVLEHMVDAVLYFESDAGSRFRIIRTTKNRFGAANELGFFAMGEQGFKEVKNPSAIFLSRRRDPAPGSVTLITREGTRPLLVEVQALVDHADSGYPRRVAQGADVQRLGMLLAVLHRHCGIAIGDGDVFTNVVGGLKVTETASDLAVALALVSSFRGRPLPDTLAVFGEIGLTGEIRPVPFGEERVAEARKHGFDRVLLPAANAVKHVPPGIDLIAVERLGEALERVFA